MIIELFGLPASGKSTLARDLHEHGFVISKVESRFHLVWYNIIFLLRYPGTSFYLFLLFLNNIRPWSLAYMKFMNVFLQHNAKYIQARNLRKAVIDQGHLQNLLSLFERKLTEEEIEVHIKNLPPVDFIIICDVSDQVREERLHARGHSPRSRMSQEYIDVWTETTRGNFAKAKSVLLKHNEHCIVAGDENTEEITKQILAQIA